MMSYDESVDYLQRRIKNTIEGLGGTAYLSDDFIKAEVGGVDLEFDIDRKNDAMPIYVIIKKDVAGDAIRKRKLISTYILGRVAIVSNGLLKTDMKGLIGRASRAAETE